ncbi:SHOCT domain-containing protein [Streptomyces sp. NPDC001982]|uniref:SHOCT domain-containing protein n=1 Tax=unclassified Streptomyces TaxID=2593676 RepID=UPI0033313B90
MAANTYLAYDYPLLGAFWTMLIFFLWIMWFILLFRIVVDIFRDNSMGGWAKAARLRDTAGGQAAPSSVDDELAKLSEIRARGDITEEEFQRAKQKVLS